MPTPETPSALIAWLLSAESPVPPGSSHTTWTSAQAYYTDRIVNADEAGLGSGLDQAEEAQLDVRDDDALVGSSPERRQRIAEAAYYRAERRGFAAGGEDDDWLEAEQEIGASGS